MSADFIQASDSITKFFWEFWRANTPALNGGNPVAVAWPGVAEPAPPDGDKPWARFNLTHFTASQQTLAPPGERTFNRGGIINVQVFAPLTSEGGLSLLKQLATIAKNSFEGKATTDDVWFRNVRIQEIGATKNWYQFNVIAEFTYDEIK